VLVVLATETSNSWLQDLPNDNLKLDHDEDTWNKLKPFQIDVIENQIFIFGILYTLLG